MIVLAEGRAVFGRWAAACDRRVGPGPGVAWPKSRCSGCEPAALAAEPFPVCPPGLFALAASRWGGVGLKAREDGVADLSFQGAQGFFGGLSLGQFLVEVGAAGAAVVADLADRSHVDGVVEPPVAAPGKPVDLALAAGHLDRRRAIVGSEVIPAGEAGHIAGGGDDGGGDDDWAGAEDLGDGRPGRGDHCGEFLPVSRIWTPMRARSSVNAVASSQRAACTAFCGVIDARTCAAWPAVIRLETPPGTSSHSTTRNRHATWVRARPRSRWRLDHYPDTAVMPIPAAGVLVGGGGRARDIGIIRGLPGRPAAGRRGDSGRAGLPAGWSGRGLAA